MLDLMQPARSSRRLLGRARQAGLETERGLLGGQSAPEFARNRHYQPRLGSAPPESTPEKARLAIAERGAPSELTDAPGHPLVFDPAQHL